jgi:hypothetical protein
MSIEAIIHTHEDVWRKRVKMNVCYEIQCVQSVLMNDTCSCVLLEV